MISIAHVLLPIVVLIGVSFLFYDRSMRIQYKRAKSLEEDGKYKEACYEYAKMIADACGSMSYQKDSAEKIQYIWQKYGPFDYSDIRATLKSKSKISFHDSLEAVISSLTNKFALPN